MAFLSHEIPWPVVSSILEVRAARSEPGFQHKSVAFTQQPGHAKRLEFFARKFHDIVRAHSLVERQRHRPSADYTARAKTWNASADATDDCGPPSVDTEITKINQPDIGEQERQKRRCMNIYQTVRPGDWASGLENRLVYPTDFPDKYGYDPDNPTLTNPHTKFVWNRVGIDIQQGISHFDPVVERRAMEPNQKYRAWLEECDLNDILKLLITDAACTVRTDRNEMLTETLFLLAHHPQLKLNPFITRGLSCCNIWHGLDNVAMLALKLFLFLNLIVSMEEDGSTELIGMREDLGVPVRYDDFLFGEKEDDPPFQAKNYVELLPRPMYMNLLTWKQVAEETTCAHEHLVETIVFRKMLFPYCGEQSKPIEIDLLSKRTLLAQHLETCWKTMVFTDMFLRELGKPLNWEYHVLSTLSDQFGWLVEERWARYSARRSIETGDSNDDNFGFFLKTDEDWPYGINTF